MERRFDYVKTVQLTGNLKYDVCLLLDKNQKFLTKNHVLAVAQTAKQLARQFDYDEQIVYQAALLHDIGAIIKPQDMLEIIKCKNERLDEAEKRFPFILHQRISKIIAKKYFHIDDDNILNAIECHTTLKASPTAYDMIVFLADKISWDQQGLPPYLDIIEKGLKVSLEKACYDYIEYLFANDKLLYPHQNILDARSFFWQTQV